MNDQKRVVWFDYAKGIAIILVVYGHVLHEVFKTGLHAKAGFCLWSDYVVYSFPMPVFFWVSGVLLSRQILAKDPSALLFGKFNTILYPYLIWSLIQGGIELVLSAQTGNVLTPVELLQSLFWQPRAQFWFLHALFFMNVISILVHKVSRSHSAKVTFAMAVVVYFFGSATLQGFEANFIYFAAGLLIAWKRIVSLPQHVTLGRTLLVTLLFVTLEYISLANGFDSYRIVRLIVAFVGIMFTVVWSITMYKKNIASLVTLIGEKSLPVYLMHVLVYKAVFIVLFALHIQQYAAFLLVGILAGVFIPLYTYIYLEKTAFAYLFTMNRPPRKTEGS